MEQPGGRLRPSDNVGVGVGAQAGARLTPDGARDRGEERGEAARERAEAGPEAAARAGAEREAEAADEQREAALRAAEADAERLEGGLAQIEAGVEAIEEVAWHHRVGLVMTALGVLLLIALLPLGFGTTVRTILTPPASRTFPIVQPVAASPAGFADLHVDLTELDQVPGIATLRVSGHYTCQANCGAGDRVVLSSLPPTERAGDTPRSAVVALSAASPEVAQTIQLPMYGQALHYPFDDYALVLGVAWQHVEADGTVRTLTRAEAADHLYLTLRTALPLFELDPPTSIDPSTLPDLRRPYRYQYAAALQLFRPVSLQLFAIAMVVLAAMVALFAVFMRPLNDLLLSVGTLLLGIWSIRSMLVPAGAIHTTLVDLGLAVVMACLLTAIAIRGLLYLLERNRIRLPGRDPGEKL